MIWKLKLDIFWIFKCFDSIWEGRRKIRYEKKVSKVLVISDISCVYLRVCCTYCDACLYTLSLFCFGHIRAARSKELITINKLILIFSRPIFEFWCMTLSMTNNLSAGPFSFIYIAISVITSKCLNNLRLKLLYELLLCMSLFSSCVLHRWLAYLAVIFYRKLALERNRANA